MQKLPNIDDTLKAYDDLKNPLVGKILPLLVGKGFCSSFVYLDKVLMCALIKKLYLQRPGINKAAFDKWLFKKFDLDSRLENPNWEKIELIEAGAEEIEEAVSVLAQTRFLRSMHAKKGAVKRKNCGVFYTPYSVAKIIAQEAIDPHKKSLLTALSGKNDHEIRNIYDKLLRLKVLDPAAGSGIILSATIEVLMDLNSALGEKLREMKWYLSNGEFCHGVLHNIYGADIDEQSCLIAQSILVCKYAATPISLDNSFVAVDALKPAGGLFSDKANSLEVLFDDVFKSGGFDIVVMNPPYERLKVDSSSYKDLPNGDELYKEDKKRIRQKAAYYKKSGHYPLSARGVLDTYKLFIERAIHLASPRGSVSFIVPFSLLGDVSCSALRKHIFHNAIVGKVFCLPENAQIFRRVSQAFCIMGFVRGGKTEYFQVLIDVSSVDPLLYRLQAQVAVHDIDTISPNSFSVPLCDELSWKVLRKMHRHPALKTYSQINNLRGEFDLTVGKNFICSEADKDVLIRGVHIKSYHLDLERSSLDYVDRSKLIQKGILGAKLQYIDQPRLVGQQIANMGLKKRLKFALVSSGVLANSCNFVYVNDNSAFNNYYLLGLLNSFLLNWRFKLTSTNNHVNNYELDELPIPTPTQQNARLVRKMIGLVQRQCQEYRDNVQAEIDLLVFALFGLSELEAAHIYDQDASTAWAGEEQSTRRYEFA